jgi:hypothetical protein
MSRSIIDFRTGIASAMATVNADTITGEQIRELRDMLVSLAPDIAGYDDEAHAEALEDIEICRLALYETEALERQPRSDWWGVQRDARERCAAILNARAASAREGNET